MRLRSSYLYSIAALSVFARGETQRPFIGQPSPVSSISIPLADHFNNKATSIGGENDGIGLTNGSTYPTEYLPTGQWLDDGVVFDLPQDWSVLEQDNIRVDSQIINLHDPTETSSLHLVAAGEDSGGFDNHETDEELTLVFEDGGTGTGSFLVKNWWGIHWTNKAPIRTPFHYEIDGSKTYNATHLFHIDIPLSPSYAGRHLKSVILPPARSSNTLHVFAMSYNPLISNSDPPALPEKLAVRSLRGTRRWDTVEGIRGQVVEISVANPFSPSLHGSTEHWVKRPVTISVYGDGFTTVRHAHVHRLMPGDEIKTEVLVAPTSSSGSFSDSVLLLESGSTSWTVNHIAIEGSALVHDWSSWSEEAQVLEEHTAPVWYTAAKFGIFIHWGLFSVPAWTDGGKYAEWYNWWLHNEDSSGGTYQHHLNTYGPDFVYDDFIPSFNGSQFNPSEWLDLFEGAGAKYFVLTTKHHDGFALFDSKTTSHRSSVHLGPHRDFVKELLDAADTRDIKKGTYFSMPEWFNPLYSRYGRINFPGGMAHNPYHPNDTEPYTGYRPADDYIEDIQLAQMRILARDYKTDLMWCDIGLANHSSAFAAEWYTETSRENRQVAIDNRCGIGGDFDTPEMTKFSTAQSRKWETCAGMDPYSFGYNSATKDEEYRNATNIIHSLVDVTAKGGNYLLNVGPDGQGKIVEAMSKPLLEAGRWLKVNGRAIYDTVPYPLQPEVMTPDTQVQFTRKPDAFYIISLQRPTVPVLKIPTPLPILVGDTITLLGSRDGTTLKWRWVGGVLHIEVDERLLAGVGNVPAWVFEVLYA